MLRAPKYVIESKIVTGLIDSEIQKQQIGIDVTVKDIYRFCVRDPKRPLTVENQIYDSGVIDFDNKARELPEVELIPWIMGNYIKLEHASFIVTTNEVFRFGNREFGHIYPRSSLNRCGASLESAVFDPGYAGSATVILLTVHNPNGLIIFRNARIGQMIVFMTGFDADEYKGVYQGKTKVANKVK